MQANSEIKVRGCLDDSAEERREGMDELRHQDVLIPSEPQNTAVFEETVTSDKMYYV